MTAFNIVVDDSADLLADHNPFVSGRIVRRTGDFERILSVKRREWKPEQIVRVQELLTERFVTALGRREGAKLLPIQGMVLAESYTQNGIFAGVGVGHGKTLMSCLAPAMLEAKRPLMFVKANLREKTIKDLREYRRHWEIPDFALVNYEQLSNANFADTLERVNPDLIIADEAHALKNSKAARTRRFLRFMKEARETKFMALSGTMARNSLRDYWALICLALRHDSPLPIPWTDLQDWADALDANVKDHKRADPGVLVELCPPSLRKPGMSPLVLARTGFQNRLRVTPGVILTTTGSADCSLILIKQDLEVPDNVQEALQTLRDTWEAPNGDLIEWAIELWRYGREIANGFYSIWDPEAPSPWYNARRDWHRFVRDVLKENMPGLDSPLQVAREFSDEDVYQKWRNIRDTFKPHSKPVWLSDYVVQHATDWLREGPGIAWVEHPCVGWAIANMSGFPYYGAGPDANKAILDEKGPCIVSIKAHGTGKNLQHYSRNLITSCIPDAATWEQLLGRTHRTGQKADEVTADVIIQCEEMDDSFDKALREAKFIKEMHGETQKLLFADKVGF
jgi:hypothetical protein